MLREKAGVTSGGWHIGVIGGSGLSDGLALDEAQDIDVASGFGDPSGPVTTGWLAGVRVTFLARHGRGHVLPPSAINYRANIDVLKRCGVTDIVALSAIGSLREDIAPGDVVVPDQFIDRTVGGGERSFFGPGLVAHVSMADPVCPRMSELLARGAEAAGANVHRGGCYVAIDGPQYSTRAESRMFPSWGGDVVGMTAMPEARLAREAELPYALLGMVTHRDCREDGEPGTDAARVQFAMAENVMLVRVAIGHLAQGLAGPREPSPIDRALDHALVTQPAVRDPALCARLGAVAGRVLGRA